MTEQEWMACIDPQKMLKFLRGKVSERKCRLFTCACCRRIWHLMKDDRSRTAVEVLEDCAEDPDDNQTWQRVGDGSEEAWRDFERDNPERLDPAAGCADSCARWAAYYINFTSNPEWTASDAKAAMVWEKIRQGINHRVARTEEESEQCRLLHDLIGNPFVPVNIDTARLPSTVVALAQAIYLDRTFDRLPSLAETLEDAGYQETALLNHLRDTGQHVRGCWALDALLGMM